jgi:hypothetical protein
MKDLSIESWKVSPPENIIYACLDGEMEAFSPNTDPERAKLIEAAPDLLYFLKIRAKTDIGVSEFLKAMELL